MVPHRQVVPKYWLICSVVCIALLAACTQIEPTPSPTHKGSSSSSTTKVPGLGAAPQHCPPGPTPKKVNSAFGPAIGYSPLWAAGFGGPHAMLSLANAPYTQDGWQVKILWLLEPNLMQPITLQGSDEAHASRHLSFNVAGQITQTPLLDPRGTAHDQWTTFPSHLFVPAVGCYVLKATWAGNTWQVPFTAVP